LIGGIPIFIGAIVQNRWDQVMTLSPMGAGSLIFVILLPTLFCHWAYYKVVSMFPVSLAAIGTLPIPVVGITTSAWILNESIEWNELAAMVLILSALSLVMIHPVTKRA
jgi:drug/metabolite transporter (DMT)-like permease